MVKEVPALTHAFCLIWWPFAWQPFSASTTSGASGCVTDRGPIWWRPTRTNQTKLNPTERNRTSPVTSSRGTCSAICSSSKQCRFLSLNLPFTSLLELTGSYLLNIRAEFEDWRPGLSQLLQPVPFPDDALADEVFIRSAELIALFNGLVA